MTAKCKLQQEKVSYSVDYDRNIMFIIAEPPVYTEGCNSLLKWTDPNLVSVSKTFQA